MMIATERDWLMIGSTYSAGGPLYSGFLSPYLSTILEMACAGDRAEIIKTLIARDPSLAKRSRATIGNTISNILKAYKVEKIAKKKAEALPTYNYYLARKEHAWLLRAEGVKYSEIGRRLDVGPEMARMLVRDFGRRIKCACRKTRWNFSTQEGYCFKPLPSEGWRFAPVLKEPSCT